MALQDLAGDGRAPLADHVAPPELDAGQARLLGGHLHELLDGEVHLRRAEVGDRIHGLELGADDYLAKPFALAELVARLRAVVRRHLRQPKDGVLQVGDLVVDSDRHYVERVGKRIQLTPKEFQLLEYLALNAGYVISRSMIAEKIWGHGFESYSNAIDVHVNNLRKKIDRGAKKLLHTAKGLGYVLEEREDDAGG